MIFLPACRESSRAAWMSGADGQALPAESRVDDGVIEIADIAVFVVIRETRLLSVNRDDVAVMLGLVLNLVILHAPSVRKTPRY